MPQTNIIVNGTFDLGDAGWSGTDLETNYAENAYLYNGSGNRVAELDGHTGMITIMKQVVTIDRPLDTDLTFRSALRAASSNNAQTEGFQVEVMNAQGGVIATQTFFPQTAVWQTYSMPVSFPAGGTYTIRLTELGPDDSLGAIIDDVSMLACFTTGTMIDTSTGQRRVESLSPGDLIWTKDDGLQPLRWIGQRQISLPELLADAALRPVLFAPGSLGAGLPDSPMALSPQHRVCLGGWQAELYFGQPEVLVPAHALINGTTICRAAPQAAVTYVHFLLDRHQIVRADGMLSESFFPTALSLTGLDRAARAEVLRLFPDLASLTFAYPETARPVLRRTEALLVA